MFDSRNTIVEEILSAPKDVKLYLIDELKKVRKDTKLQEALSGHLYPETSIERQNLINQKLDKIINFTQ